MNLWAQFQKMTGASSPTQIVEVVTVYAAFADVQFDGMVLPGTAVIRVRAPGRSLEVGQRWIVKDGAVVEEGPGGPVLAAEV